jgi:hypothetical protein
MDITITISKKDVLHQVKQETYLTGEALKTDDITKVSSAAYSQASDDNDDILSTYLSMAETSVRDLLTPYVRSVSADGDEVSYQCAMPQTYDESQTSAIVRGITSYMAAYILYRWYGRVAPDKADASELELLKSDIAHRLNQRVRPTRRIAQPIGF